jgi:hypothetical protein
MLMACIGHLEGLVVQSKLGEQQLQAEMNGRGFVIKKTDR